MAVAGSRGDCPDPATIASFAGRGLAAGAAAQLEVHLAECDDCRTLVFALASGDASATNTTETEVDELRRVGRFEVIGELGRGAMGVVLRARDVDLDRLVAVKVSRGHARLDVDGEDRLRREAQALARLVHPNVVAIHEIGQHEGRAFVAMEYVDGVALDAWIAEGHPVSDVLALFVGAARGLAAAHAVGLVHRDVKPSNIFVAGGVAKIGDFGLVRFGGAEGGPADVTADERALTLSVTGAMIGTPAYMAPEQLRGEVATEASDQFSFCVTMFEALYGRRPFAGATIAELRAAFDRPVALPAGSPVPVWIGEVLARGLAIAPRDRWPSLAALADALENDPLAARRRRWRQIGGGVVLAAFATVAIVATVRARSASAPGCTGFAAQLAGVWDPARAEGLRAAFAATGLPYAGDTATRVATALDHYRAGWIGARTEACEATRVRGDQTEAQMELRMACLDRRRVELRALVDVLGAKPTAQVIDNAVTATQALAPLGDCANLAALAEGIPLPADARTRGRVVELQQQLATVTAMYETGQYAEGLTRAKDAVTTAETLAFSPTLAEAMHLRARLEAGTGDLAAAAATYEKAIPVAGDARDDVRVAQQWADLVHVLADAGRPEDAVKLQPAVDAAWKRAGSPPALEIKLLVSYGDVAMALGKPAEAEAKYQRALAINDQALGPGDHRFIGSILNNLGIAQQQQGRFAESVQTYRRALAIDEGVLGPAHPLLAAVITNIGVGLASQGDYDGGRVYDLRALAILEKALGPAHQSVGAALDNVAAGYLSQGRYAEARPYQLRAIAIFEASDPDTNTLLAGSLANLGVAYLAEENLGEARRAAMRSLAIYEKVGGPAHPTLSAPLLLLGAIEAAEGHHAAGLAAYERSLAISEKALGPEHPDVASALTGMAQEALALGQTAVARTAAERALPIRSQPDMPPFELAETRFALARALWPDAKARPRATELLAQARKGFEEAAEAGTKQLAELVAWQRTH